MYVCMYIYKAIFSNIIAFSESLYNFQYRMPNRCRIE